MPRPRATTLLAAALAVGVLACSDDESGGNTTVSTAADVATTAPATTAPDSARDHRAAGAYAPASSGPLTAPAPPAGWTRIVPGGECTCATRGEFSFWDHRGDPTKVVLFFQGGGACFNAEQSAR